MQNRFGLLDMDVMPIFMIIALDIFVTMHFSINCSAIIYSPIVIHAIMGEATSETYSSRVYFISYKFPIYLYLQCLLSNLYQKNTKNIYLILLSLSDLTFASGREGIDNPSSHWLRGSCLFV